MHTFDDSMADLADAVLAFARERTERHPIDLGAPKPPDELDELCGQTITTEGIGAQAAMRMFADVLEPAALSVDHQRYLSFIPAAPTEAAVLFDLAVGASSIYGGSWLEGAGAVWAENQALAWLVEIAGLPGTAGGVFVAGGTVGNLSAMAAARDTTAAKRGRRPDRWAFLASEQTHSSVASMASIMDADVIAVETDDRFRMTGEAVAAALDEHGDRIAAVVTTSGTTNLGIIDDLRGIGEVCRERDVWMHVDGAYGAAGMASPTWRPLFDGIELADSYIVDPHKWLFAPFDCCALIYRNPENAKRSHQQAAGYLEFLDQWGDWNPSDYAAHLTRRVRGLPFWFSLATHGTDAYARAIDATMDVSRYAAEAIRAADHLTLLAEPVLSVVAFARDGWDGDRYQAWSLEAMHEGTAFVTPSRFQGDPCYRFCFVNPLTTTDDVDDIIAQLAS
ncbi:MAG: aminotransferase class I/II-fold pyridoxal phosphate-dependent enzyme [Actinomycetota bacterium]